jgi:hypothetical protein
MYLLKLEHELGSLKLTNKNVDLFQKSKNTSFIKKIIKFKS